MNPSWLGTPTQVYGSFYSLQTQPVDPSGLVGIPLSYTNTAIANDAYTEVDLLAPALGATRVRVRQAGIYRLSYSIQLLQTVGGNHNVEMWIRLNGVNVPDSSSRVRLKGNQDEQTPYCDYILRLIPEDYVEVMFYSTEPSVTAETYAGIGIYPDIPSIITNIFRIE